MCYFRGEAPQKKTASFASPNIHHWLSESYTDTVVLAKKIVLKCTSRWQKTSDRKGNPLKEILSLVKRTFFFVLLLSFVEQLITI